MEATKRTQPLLLILGAFGVAAVLFPLFVSSGVTVWFVEFGEKAMDEALSSVGLRKRPFSRKVEE